MNTAFDRAIDFGGNDASGSWPQAIELRKLMPSRALAARRSVPPNLALSGPRNHRSDSLLH
jgi:hypothetical protein